MTDKELNQICSMPRTAIDVHRRGKYTPYEVYIADGFYKSMEPGRMVQILKEMLKSNVYYAEPERNKIKEAIIECEKACKGVPGRNGVQRNGLCAV